MLKANIRSSYVKTTWDARNKTRFFDEKAHWLIIHLQPKHRSV